MKMLEDILKVGLKRSIDWCATSEQIRLCKTQSLTSLSRKLKGCKYLIAISSKNRIYMLILLSRFLLAQLHMDSLAKKKSRRDVRKALENLPKELDDTYMEAMQRIESQHEDDVKLAEGVLSWISFTFRPLTIRELQHALAVEPE